MRILLCQSYLGDRTGEPLVFPLGLAYLASSIKDKHEVSCWDPNVVQNPLKELSSILERTNPEVVALSLRNIDSVLSFNKRFYYPMFVSMLKTIKKAKPSCKLVVGGSAFSIFCQEIMDRNPEIDFGIFLEGEYPFAELLNSFDHPERVRNLFFRRDGILTYTGSRGFDDFSLLPEPSRSLFDLEPYRLKPYSMGVQSKRGCCFNCITCNNKLLVGSSYRTRSPKKVVDEIERTKREYEINSFFFVDSSFNFPFEHARAICQEIIRRRLDVTWQAEFRPEYINHSFMEQAVKAGCQQFNFSPDGASNGALQVLGKDFKVSQIENTISCASNIEGANVGYNFLYDIPYCNSEHVSGLLRLVPKMMLHLGSQLKYVSLTKIRIFPHTPVYEIAMRQGKITKDTDLLYPIHYGSKSLNAANCLTGILRGSSILYDAFMKKFT